MLDFFLVVLFGLLTFAAIVLFYHHYLWKRLRNPRDEQWALGALMGLGSLFVMLSAVDVGNGVLLDARVLLMGFAALLAGWRGALAALMITLPARLLIGGAGAYIGCLTLLMAPLIGLAWRQFEARLSWGPSWRFLVFGALLQLSLGTIMLFPEPQRTLALRDAVLPLLILNMIGALLAGWMELGINQSVVRAERWRRRALTDDLTGLGNRLQLTETIERKLQEIKQQGGSFALISLDLDNFRHINDTLGHKIGDAVLVAIARRLSDSLTPQDMLVRVAGDQFVVMMSSASANEIIQHARQLLSTAAAPLQIEHYVLLLTASIGVVWSPQNGAESRLLLQNAEIAMYRSKYRGRNQVTCFDDNMRTELERQTGLTQALRLALESKRDLRLVFQPQFSLVDRHLTGAEVLLRWRHPQLGDISPAEFVPLAEQAGLSGLLDRFVMEQAAIQQAAWVRAGFSLKLSINLSVLSLRVTGLAKEILALLGKYDIPAQLMEVEVTESVDLEGSSEAMAEILQLRAAGVSIALDDFGTGHSSLSYLQQLPLDIVKIDQSFVRRIQPAEGPGNSILRAIIALAKALHLEIIAEGVETEEQHNWLAAEGCDIAQGYLHGKPVDRLEFEQRYLRQSA